MAACNNCGDDITAIAASLVINAAKWWPFAKFSPSIFYIYLFDMMYNGTTFMFSRSLVMQKKKKMCKN